MNIKDLLQLVVDTGASDLHLMVGIPPTLRVEGVLSPVPNEEVLTPEVLEAHLKDVLSAEQFELLKVNKEIDFSLSFSEKGRFRVNAYVQRGTLAAAFRIIPLEIPTIESLGLPKVLHSFTEMKQGFILVTGPTGHGKSTTLASILNEINENRACHIVTVEDPIEFVFKPARAIVSQREMHEDTHSWQAALRSILREDPDVVLIGEMRDYETIASALTIAETGHLVFATLHTNSAAQTIDRVVDVFPEEQQRQVRMQLANVIEAVFSQRLVPTVTGKRVVAYELLLATNAVRTTIRDGKTFQIDNVIQTSFEAGMCTIESSLASLVKSGKISLEVAQSWSLRPEELIKHIKSDG
jgi:twitching motility protein PilT